MIDFIAVTGISFKVYCANIAYTLMSLLIHLIYNVLKFKWINRRIRYCPKLYIKRKFLVELAISIFVKTHGHAIREPIFIK